MNTTFHISGVSLTRNWGMNLVSQALVVGIAVPTVPFIVHRLGAERFGVLSIAWVLLGYFGLFDLGLGRATTKYTAECLGRGELATLSEWVWTSLFAQVALGAVGTLITAFCIPIFVHHILKVPIELTGETQTSFLILSAALPLILAAGSLRGVLEAGQRFDLVNYVRVPTNLSLFLLPAVALLWRARLPGIILLLVLGRGASALSYLALCLRHYPTLQHEFSVDFRRLCPLLSYGGWVTVSAVLGPLLAYFDRFLIGSMLSMSAVGYYSVPSEAINRISIVPGSLNSTIFPAFSTLDATGSAAKIEELCSRSLKALLLMLGPVTILIIAFARPALRLWLGIDFAARGTSVLQILAVGMLANALALVPYGMLQAMGRPDLTAKFHVLEFPLYALLLWFVVPRMNIDGAAMAWAIRVVVDAALLFGAAMRFGWLSIRALQEHRILRTAGVICGFGTLLAIPNQYLSSPWIKGAIAFALLPALALAGWKYLLDGRDRHLLLSLLGQPRWALSTAK